MVDQALTKEEALDGAHGEATNEKKASQGNKTFKKKGSKGSGAKKKNKGVHELLRGVGFSISRDRLDFYLKALKRLGYMYAPHTIMDPNWRCAWIPKN